MLDLTCLPAPAELEATTLACQTRSIAGEREKVQKWLQIAIKK